MSALEVGVGILAVWRLTHLLQAEDGPWDLLVRLRRLAGDGVVGSLLDCFYCLSLWIAVPFALWAGGGLGGDWRQSLVPCLVLWPALSGGVILLERATASRQSLDQGAPWYTEDPEPELDPVPEPEL